MPEKSQQLSSHYLAILAMEGMGAILDWKGQKIKKNGQVLTKNKVQKNGGLSVGQRMWILHTM